MKRKFKLFRNCSEVLTLTGVVAKDGRHIQDEDLTVIKNAAVLVENGQIKSVIPQKKIPRALAKENVQEMDLQKRQVLPAFVECHTHSLFAGNRADEFELRNQGVSYQDIARRGGGILSTMRHTRTSSMARLEEITQERVNRFVRQGVGTLEIKTGYALNFKDELKCLKAIAKLKGLQIISTFLGAHAIPPEFKTASEYLVYLTQEVLPTIRRLTNRVDIFVEKGFFELNESKKYLQRAKDLGFDICIHGDQLSLSGGGDLGVELGAKSVDHLICIGDSQIAKLAKSTVTCVLLPAADLYMKCAYPPARKLIEAGARVAIATDFNPGSCPTQDLSLVGLLSRLQMRMTLPEVISAYTFGASAALGLEKKKGHLSENCDADFVVIDCDWRELFYSVGVHPIWKTVLSGKIM